MRKYFALVAIALAIAIAVFFADRPGAVSVVWQGWEIDTSLGIGLLVLLIGMVTLWLVMRVVSGVVLAPARAMQRRRASRQLLGYRVLTDGLVAIAAGDARGAERLRLKAEKLFRQGHVEAPPLFRLLTAQTALMRGDDGAARGEFNAMLESPDTEFLGLRGLIVQALKRGDDATALELTERAHKLRPTTAWVLQNQLALETRAGEWLRAQETLRMAIKRNVVTDETGRHHKATLLVARSRAAIPTGNDKDVMTFAAQAYALDQGFAPAAIHYAQVLARQNRAAKGLRVLETAWSRGGHPAVAEAYEKGLAAETPAARLKQFEKLVDMRPSDPEGHLAAGALALSARLWGEARRHLDRAGAGGPGPWRRRVCDLMAELEEGETGNEAAIRQWLERAAHAPEDPIWVCAACGAETHAWEPLCPTCQGFDGLQWRIPDRTRRRGTEHEILSPVIDISVPAPRDGPLSLIPD